MNTTINTDVSKTAKPEPRDVPFIHSENGIIPPWYESPNSQPTANLNPQTSQAARRDKAMNTDSQDKVNNVMLRLETLNNLFEFYMYAHNTTGFNIDSLNGLCIIISDCIAELKEAVK